MAYETEDENALECCVCFNSGKGRDFIRNEQNKRGYYIKLRIVRKDGSEVREAGLLVHRIFFKEATRRSKRLDREALEYIYKNVNDWSKKYKIPIIAVSRKQRKKAS